MRGHRVGCKLKRFKNLIIAKSEESDMSSKISKMVEIRSVHGHTLQEFRPTFVQDSLSIVLYKNVPGTKSENRAGTKHARALVSIAGRDLLLQLTDVLAPVCAMTHVKRWPVIG